MIMRSRSHPRHSACCTLHRASFLMLFAVAAGACSGPNPPQGAAATPAERRIPIGELPDIDTDAVLRHTRILSSDEFQGRAPGSKGEELTVAYLVDQFQKI